MILLELLRALTTRRLFRNNSKISFGPQNGLTPWRLQRDKLTTKIDAYGVGHCWLAMIKVASELQQMQSKARAGRGAGGMILLAGAARSHQLLDAL